MPRRKLTDTIIRSLGAPSKGQTVVYDAALPRFGLRLSAGGARTWVVRYKTRSRSRWLTLGTYPLVSLATARTEAKKALAQVVQGEDPAAERRAVREAATFGELAAEYLEKHARRKKRSWKEDERILTKYIPKAWHAAPAREVTRRQVRELLDHLAERTPIFANRVLACVRKVFNFGIDREIVDSNPCSRVPRPGVERQRDRVLTPEELRRLWPALAAGGDTGTILRVMLYTAQRGGEVKRMRWEDLDLDAGWWTVPAVVAKNRFSHRVPLSPPALALLRDLQANANGSPWIFTALSASGHRIAIQKALKRIRRATGQPCVACPACAAGDACATPRDVIAFRPHDLRRTVATFLTSELGVSRLVVSKLLNHVERGVTAVYDRASYDREKQAALNAWAARLEQIVNEREAAATAKVIPLRAGA